LGRPGGVARRPRQLGRDPLAADPWRRRGAGQPPRGARRPGSDRRGDGAGRHPAEGTILTVVREMAHRVASELAHMRDARLEPGASAEEQNAVIAEVIERALEAGEESVKRGPDLLPVLRESGVVDAGGYALTVLFAGIVGA